MKCKKCKAKFEPKYFNQKHCMELEDCIKAEIDTKRAQKWNKEKKALKESLKTKYHYEKILQILINKIIRLIDNGCPCIATGNSSGKMNAGHYVSVGSNSTLRFHLDNIHIQSEHSNSYKGGDLLNYQDGLKKVYGVQYFIYVDSLRQCKPIKLSIEDLKEKIIIAKSIVNELENNKIIYSTKDRLELRKKFNKKLGIYD